MDARPGSGREERRGRGGGRESGGGNNVAGAAPAEFRFQTPPPRFDVGTSRRLPGAAPDAGSRRRRRSPRSTPRRLRRPQAGWGGRDRWPGGWSRRRRGRETAPLGPHPSKISARGAGWGESGRAAAVAAAAATAAAKLGSPWAPLGGSSQAWREEARPGSSARGTAPARGSRPGARRGVGRRSSAPCRAPETLRGVCPRARPAPACPPAVEAPEGPSGRAGPPALEQPPRLPRCRSDGGQASAPLLGSVCAQGPSPAGAFIRSQAFPGPANVTGPVQESARRAAWWLSRSSQHRQASRQALGNN